MIFSESDTGLSGIQREASSAEDSFSEKSLTIDKHSCGVCLRTYSSQQSLRHHKRTHHQNEKSFQCHTCLKYFVERSTLKRHMIIHMDEKPYKCDHCDRAFSDKSTLRRHIITHTGTKRFVCTNCNKRFTRNEHLRQHMYIHTAEKLYKCEICTKDFRQRSTLKNHMLLHRADKAMKWKCDTCNTSFEFQHEYDVHVAICDSIGGAQGEKCQFCEKRFLDNDVLLRHMLSHAEERSYKCEFCNQSFSDKSELTDHEFLHSEKKPYKCVICDQDFMRKGSLLSHITSQHPEQAVYELVDPSVDYQITNGAISLDSQALAQSVRFVLPGTANVSDVSLRQMKLSNEKMKNSSLENSPNIAVNMATNSNGMRNSQLLDQTSSLNQCHTNEAEMQREDNHLNLQPGDNQLLQVDLVQMDNGNQFVQAIHAYIQPNQHLNNQSSDSQPFKHLKNCVIVKPEELSDLVVDENLILGDDNFNGERDEGGESIIDDNNVKTPNPQQNDIAEEDMLQ